MTALTTGPREPSAPLPRHPPGAEDEGGCAGRRPGLGLWPRARSRLSKDGRHVRLSPRRAGHCWALSRTRGQGVCNQKTLWVNYLQRSQKKGPSISTFLMVCKIPFLFLKTFTLFLYFYNCAKLLQSCPTLCDPMDCSPLSMGFFRQEYWSGLPCPPPGGSFQSRDPNCVSYISCIWQIGSVPPAPPGNPSL